MFVNVHYHYVVGRLFRQDNVFSSPHLLPSLPPSVFFSIDIAGYRRSWPVPPPAEAASDVSWRPRSQWCLVCPGRGRGRTTRGGRRGGCSGWPLHQLVMAATLTPANGGSIFPSLRRPAAARKQPSATGARPEAKLSAPIPSPLRWPRRIGCQAHLSLHFPSRRRVD